MQIITVLLLMVSLLQIEGLSGIAGLLVNPFCFYILAVLGVSSGIDYVITWGSKAYREGKKRKLYKHGRGAFRRPPEA